MKRCYRWQWIKVLLSDVWVQLEQKNIATIPSTIKNYIELCSWQDSEYHVLHYSVDRDYMEAVESLIKSGYKFDVEDSPGVTPLITAILKKNFQEARILHLAHMVYLLNTELQNTIHMQFQFLDWRQVEIPIVRNLVKNLREETKLNSHEIGEVLAKVTKFHTCDVVFFNDRDITKAYLQTLEPRYGTYRAFEIIMPTFDLDHAKVILRYHQDRHIVERKFCRYIITEICNYQKSRAGREFLKKVFSWDVFTEDTLIRLEDILEETKRIDSVKVFLQYNFHVAAKAKYGRDLLACLFANYHNPKVVSVLKNEMIDIYGRGYHGNTPLHFAAHRHLVDNVRFLLEKGANPNAFNNCEQTPLERIVMRSSSYFDQEAYGCVKLLLLAGANPLLISHNVEGIDRDYLYDENHYFTDFVKVIELIVAQVVVYEALGHSIDDFVYLELCNHELKDLYDECSMQVNEMKSCKIRDNLVDQKNELTMFSILGENPKKIFRYFVEEDLLLINAYLKNNDEKLNSYYKDLLKKHVDEIVEMNRCRVKATRIICEFIGINDPHHLVVRKIVNYLSADDICKLSMTRAKSSRLKLTKRFTLKF